MRQAHPGQPLEVWAQDEHRVGLKPIVRWVWARRGQRIVAAVHPRYVWTYLYAFVRPSSGATWWLLLPSVRADLYTLALTRFAQAVGAGPERQVVLVIDQAGWHVSHDVQVPEGLHLVFLPAYSPELQPAERLWALSDEPLANRPFADIEALEAVQAARCAALRTQSARIQALTRYHWWPHTA